MASDLIADATEFMVSITHNMRLGTSYSYIPAPVLDKLDNPKGLRVVIQGNEILVTRSD